MKNISLYITLFCLLFISANSSAQDYFLKTNGPFEDKIKSPESFLNYAIGSHHTRHDRLVAYFEYLAKVSDKAQLEVYGETFEKRPLIIFTITTPSNLKKLDQLKKEHLKLISPTESNLDYENQPIFINLGYSVHGNEPSSAEAAMLTGYTLVASKNQVIKNYLENSVVFIDPVINPDGRERHTQWVNMYKANPLVADPMDAEHNEAWPRGRTNHYWFDLNRDWYLAINPESRGKLKWYHQWYPNVVSDFHEMGTNMTYYIEPGKANASKHPLMPKENYTTLNNTFAKYYAEELDKIGSLYFSKEIFDDTYPGYGSSYSDIQGGLGLLFEQASSRGHIQERDRGKLTFAFTIRNHYISSMTTVQAAVENKEMMLKYQHDFFKSSVENAKKNAAKAFVFGDQYDKSRTMAFIDKLLLHQVKVYRLKENLKVGEKNFSPEFAYIIPTEQAQYRMVQSAFETHSEYSDSVYYDASAWSLPNFYNMSYAPLTKATAFGEELNTENNIKTKPEVTRSTYAYITSYDDYYAPSFLYNLLESGVNVSSAFKPFIAMVENKSVQFGYGSLVIPVHEQKISEDSLFRVVAAASDKWKIEVNNVNTGYNQKGIDLGSANVRTVQNPKVFMLIGEGVSSSEAGEIWHLMDTRVGMPITKVSIQNFNSLDLPNYNVMIMVSGGYGLLDSAKQQKLKSWINEGKTLITTRQASSWVIKNKLVQDSLVVEDKSKKEVQRLNYVDAREHIGKKQVGGAIFEVDIDITHPLAFGYHDRKLPVYKNSNVWLKPSKNPYATVAKYTDNPHIDGFITEKNLNEFLKPSASLIVSKVGNGRVVMFADNPNFRSSFYGTNRLLLNAIFLGNHINVPE